MLAAFRFDIPDDPSPRSRVAAAPTVDSLLHDLRVATSRAMWAAAEASLTWPSGLVAQRWVRSARRLALELHEEARLTADTPEAVAVATEGLERLARAAGRLAAVRLTPTPWVPATRINGFRAGPRGRVPAGHLTEPAAVDAVLSCALAVDAYATALAGRPDMVEVARQEAGAAHRAACRFRARAERTEPGAAETLAATAQTVAETVEVLGGLVGGRPVGGDLSR